MTNATKEIKVTKVMKFTKAIEVCPEIVEIEGQEINLKEFFSREIELIQKKASSPSKRKAVDNSAEMALVREALADGVKLSASEIALKAGLKSTPKATAVLKAMGDEILREQKGKKVTFCLA